MRKPRDRDSQTFVVLTPSRPHKSRDATMCSFISTSPVLADAVSNGLLLRVVAGGASPTLPRYEGFFRHSSYGNLTTGSLCFLCFGQANRRAAAASANRQVT